jgi:hypothetical protein
LLTFLFINFFHSLKMVYLVQTCQPTYFCKIISTKNSSVFQKCSLQAGSGIPNWRTEKWKTRLPWFLI